MPDILIKNVPNETHKKLKEMAQYHHRSMTKEALAVLEEAAAHYSAPPLPAPVKGHFPITKNWLKKAVKEGRS